MVVKWQIKEEGVRKRVTEANMAETKSQTESTISLTMAMHWASSHHHKAQQCIVSV